MTQPIEQVLIGAEGRYLKADELDVLKTFAQEWSERAETYRWLRDHESELTGQILQQLKQEIPNLNPQIVERCQQDLLLMLRNCALAMLTTDREILEERVTDWIEEQVRLYSLESVYEALYRLLQHHLKQSLTSRQLELIRPYVTEAQVALIF